MPPISVVLAIASPMLRVRLVSWLRDEPTICVLGEAGTGAQAADIVVVTTPEFVLCDRMMLADPDLAEVLTFPGRKPRIVMIAVNNETLPSQAVVPVVRTVSYHVRGSELARRLGGAENPPAADPAEPAHGKVLELAHRFSVNSGPDRRLSSNPEPRPDPKMPGAFPTGRVLNAPKVRLASALLALQLNPWQYPLDATTGMVGPAAMDKALNILLEVKHPAAFIEIEARDPDGNSFRVETADQTLLRHMAATIRATVRHYDLLCRTGPASFTLLMPDLLKTAAETRMQQLRLALGPICLAHLGADGPPQVHLSAGFWSHGMDPVQVLTECRQSMPGKAPVPTKTAQLARTSFFKSVFDVPAAAGGVATTY